MTPSVPRIPETEGDAPVRILLQLSTTLGCLLQMFRAAQPTLLTSHPSAQTWESAKAAFESAPVVIVHGSTVVHVALTSRIRTRPNSGSRDERGPQVADVLGGFQPAVRALAEVV